MGTILEEKCRHPGDSPERSKKNEQQSRKQYEGGWKESALFSLEKGELRKDGISAHKL